MSSEAGRILRQSSYYRRTRQTATHLQTMSDLSFLHRGRSSVIVSHTIPIAMIVFVDTVFEEFKGLAQISNNVINCRDPEVGIRNGCRMLIAI